MSTPNNQQFRPNPSSSSSKNNNNNQQQSSTNNTEDELRRELEYTRDVLRRYREYVQANYDRKLQEATEEVELLRQELDEFQIENSELKKELADSREGIHRANVNQDESSKQIRAELGRVLDQHSQHVEAMKTNHQQEVSAAQKRIADLEGEVKQLKKMSDPEALRREANSEAQRKISHLEAQLEGERAQNQQSTKRLQAAEAAQKLVASLEKQLRAAVSNVHDLSLDSHETSSQLGVGLSHAGVDAVGPEDLSGGWQRSLKVTTDQQQQQQGNNKNNNNTSTDDAGATIRINVLAESLLASLLEVRRAVAQERSGISRGVRQLLGDKEAAEVELQRKEQVFQQELQLYQRRMTEMEEDRYAEHHAANTAADRARHMDLLRDPRGALVEEDEVANNRSFADGSSGNNNNNASRLLPPPSRSQLMSFAGGAGGDNTTTNGVAPQSMAPFYGQQQNSKNSGTSAGFHKRTIAIQTGVELMLNAPGNDNNKNKSHNNNNNNNSNHPSSRLIAELEETQEQLTRAREVVRLLDMQRQQFMYFVEDPRLEEDVARALGAGSVSTSDFVQLSGRRFIQHTA